MDSGVRHGCSRGSRAAEDVAVGVADVIVHVEPETRRAVDLRREPVRADVEEAGALRLRIRVDAIDQLRAVNVGH